MRKETLDDVLAHFGVKGMKWGVRRDPRTGARPISVALNSSRFGQAANKNAERYMAKQNRNAAEKAARPKKLTSAQVKAEKADFYQRKANNILKTAAKDPESLIALRTHNDAVIVTGKQFIDHMVSGGVMNIKMTDVYATRRGGAGKYILNPNINRPYIRSDKLK